MLSIFKYPERFLKIESVELKKINNYTHVRKSVDMPGNPTDSQSSKIVLLFFKEDRLKIQNADGEKK